MKLIIIISSLLFVLGQDCKNSNQTVQTRKANDSTLLDGNWMLSHIAVPGLHLDSLFKDKKPTISFNLAANKFSGNTSCNNFNGELKVSGNAISFTDPFAMTRMACPGDGEKAFLETLNKVDHFNVTGKNTLNFMQGDGVVLKFTRQ